MPEERHNYHPDAPTNDDGYPIHPERGHPICGRNKSGGSPEYHNKNSRTDVPYCLRRPGHGCDEDRGRGQACSDHGGEAGAPEGPRNGNWKLGLYSDYMTEDDAERAEDWLELSDGDRLTVDQFIRMGEKALLFEFTRIERAMLQSPDPDLSEKYACKFCGFEMPSKQVMTCPQCDATLKPDEILTTAEWVDTHDRQISERIERWVDMLQTYKEVVEGSDLNVNLGVEFEEAIRRAEDVADADAEGKTEMLVGEEGGA